VDKTKKPFISITTATWNREKFLKKLGNSLMKQTYKNFEWIIGNDGSTDNTDALVKKIALKADFKIIYINSTLRIGKSKMDNLMNQNVSGEYLTQCGSDDILLPNALKILSNLTKKIPKKEKDSYIGIYADSIDTNRVSQTFAKNQQTFKGEKSLYWEDLKKNTKGDATILEQFKFLKNKKFLEVDFLITESSLLDKLYCKKKFILTSKIVKIMDRSAENSISFGKKLSYCRGSAYSIASDDYKKNFLNYSLLLKLKTVLNYWRYSVHGDIKFLRAKKMFKATNNNPYYKVLFPLAYLVCAWDNILGKVEKTHIEFNKNIKKTKITVDKLN